MNQTNTPKSQPARIRLRVAQVIMVLPLGAVVLFGAIIFGFVSPTEPMGTAEYAVCVWAIAQGLLAVYFGIRLVSGPPSFRTFAVLLMACHFLFGVVKLAFWQESAAVPFMVLDVVAAGLIVSAGRELRPAGSGAELAADPDRPRSARDAVPHRRQRQARLELRVRP
ncbi:MAG: hypothetical protein QM648_00810 [Solirubrobacterales bacterium]